MFLDNHQGRENLISDKKLHLLFLVFFLAISIFFTLGRVGTAFNSFALLTPDLGVYASFAAAQDQPGLFANDPFLSNEENINSYNMVYVPLIKGLKTIFGNYGTACAFLLPFFLFIHLTGYYVLGISIFKNPWAGLLFSLLISAPALTYYDFWGLILDALPRFLYQGLVPFLLALSIARGNNPRWWPVILGGLGVLNYVHPLSTPTWALAITLALWVSVNDLGFWKKAGRMVPAIGILVIILLPFLMNYLESTVTQSSTVVNYEQTIAILQTRFSTMSTADPLAILSNFFVSSQGFVFDFIWYFICGLAGAGLIYGLLFWQPASERGHVRQISAWIAGVFIASGLLPILEQAVFAHLNKIPPEFELLRSLRYMIPLILLAAFYALWLARNHIQHKLNPNPASLNRLLAGASILLLAAWGLRGESQRHEFRDAVRQNVTCWLQARIICSLPRNSMDFIDVLDAVREKTPVGARIFSEGQEVAVRYFALRPLVYTYKDGAPLAYTDSEQLLIWNEQYTVMNRLAYIRQFPFRRKGFMKDIVELAVSAGAEYLILSEPYDSNLFYPASLILVYSNENYSFYRINR